MILSRSAGVTRDCRGFTLILPRVSYAWIDTKLYAGSALAGDVRSQTARRRISPRRILSTTSGRMVSRSSVAYARLDELKDDILGGEVALAARQRKDGMH